MFSLSKLKAVYLCPFLSSLPFLEFRKQNLMYFRHKHVEIEPSCSHELANFFKYQMPLITFSSQINRKMVIIIIFLVTWNRRMLVEDKFNYVNWLKYRKFLSVYRISILVMFWITFEIAIAILLTHMAQLNHSLENMKF